ncbi:MAG TPA: hypothetical protein VG297_19245 [Bryobacteraceae bacterium]|jgi:hypothetical protein|nr:hypothetical protein [Bryobacteraceae bacterium]
MRIVRKILLAVVALTALLYAVDFAYAHARKAPFADVRIERFLAIAEHFNKVSYERTDPITERCVYALFPQYGYAPCWYLMRHTVRFVNVG